jgi:hypothetical protein
MYAAALARQAEPSGFWAQSLRMRCESACEPTIRAGCGPAGRWAAGAALGGRRISGVGRRPGAGDGNNHQEEGPGKIGGLASSDCSNLVPDRDGLAER